VPRERIPLTPTQRSLRARIAAKKRWSQSDPVEGTAAARAAGPGQMAYWLRRVDPDESLPAQERQRRAESAKAAHFLVLALKSAKARGARSQERRGSGSAALGTRHSRER